MGREVLLGVRYWSWDPPWGLGRVGRSSRRSGMGWLVLPEVWDGPGTLPEVWYRLGALPEVRDGSWDTPKSFGTGRKNLP